MKQQSFKLSTWNINGFDNESHHVVSKITNDILAIQKVCEKHFNKHIIKKLG